MRARGGRLILKSLSSRILAGFTLLIVVFGLVSGFTVANLDALSQDIERIRTGALEFALSTKDLASRQEALYSFLADELIHETDPQRAKHKLVRLQFTRDDVLAQAEASQEKFLANPVSGMRQRRRNVSLANIRRIVDEQSGRYKQLVDFPPLNRMRGELGTAAQYQQALEILDELRTSEKSVFRLVRRLEDNQRAQLKSLTASLQEDSQQVRWVAVALGVIAVIIGILIVVWAIVNLRPLRKLASAAGRIAEGDYGATLHEGGPQEVAHLAREFNIMAQAVRAREKDIARSSRFAAAGKMAAAMTHEIRNPLSALGLNVELLQDEIDPDQDNAESTALCRAILDEVDRLTHITEDYLQFARLPKATLEPSELTQIVQETVEFHTGPLASRDIVLRGSFDEEPIYVMADEGQIRQIVVNLIRNASDAPGADRRIDITTTTENGYGVIRVADNGPGLDEKIIPTLFEPFVTTKEKGTGLGLALASHIVAEHGGTIDVRNLEPGAEFEIRLPLRKPNVGASAP